MTENRDKFIKHFSLIFITIQTTCLVLSMRISRTPSDSPLYLISTIVVCAEVAKLLVSITLIIIQHEGNVSQAFTLMYNQIIRDYEDTLKVFIPSVLYVIQNNLLYVAISRLNAVVYQILYQTKIFTTAFFMVVILRRHLLRTQWIALCLLCLGIVLTQISSSNTSKLADSSIHSSLIGLGAIVFASLSSGFAGVYYEKILKGTEPSIWMRNIQLAIFGITVGLLGVYTYDGAAVVADGFFQGYNPLVWLVILLQTVGGLGVAFVMKYADNILKGFATGLSIILSSAVSYFVLDDFTPTTLVFMGSALVIGATFLYGYKPTNNYPSKNTLLKSSNKSDHEQEQTV